MLSNPTRLHLHSQVVFQVHGYELELVSAELLSQDYDYHNIA